MTFRIQGLDYSLQCAPPTDAHQVAIVYGALKVLGSSKTEPTAEQIGAQAFASHHYGLLQVKCLHQSVFQVFHVGKGIHNGDLDDPFAPGQP